MDWRRWFGPTDPPPPRLRAVASGEEVAPPPAPESPNEIVVRVWVHERADGVRFVHPDTVFELQRKMMKGPAAGTFCDQFELTLRRMMDSTAVKE